MTPLKLPGYARPLFTQKRRYKVLAGGRGSAKSESVARMLLAKGAEKRIRVLCGREFQNSITESVHYLLRALIDKMKLNAHYVVTNNSIYSPINGTEFFFKGIRHNIESIKSMAGITHVWLEEADSISQLSWDILIPTIREPESEIWVTFNPSDEEDPTYTMFFDKNGNAREREDAIILKVNWDRNEWFPDVLRKEKDYLYEVNPDLADHVWGGNCRRNSDSQIFKNKYVIREFEPNARWDGPYFGADFGFSTDPSTLVKVYIDRKAREILVRNAWFGYHVEIDHLGDHYESIDGVHDTLIRADCARPETISYLSRDGFSIEGVEKWKGSVEDGIDWLKSWKRIVIHPECTDMIKEAKNYSFKVDKLTQVVLRDIVDANNHGWDAIRYALNPLIQAGSASLLDVL